LPFAAEMSDTIVSKADFARLVGVSAARVSQWLGNGMIGPEALLGNGRHARVRVELAKSMLRDRLDPDRSHLGGLQAPAGDRSGLTASKTRVVDLQRELLEIKLARVQGELIPRAAAGRRRSGGASRSGNVWPCTAAHGRPAPKCWSAGIAAISPLAGCASAIWKRFPSLARPNVCSYIASPASMKAGRCAGAILFALRGPSLEAFCH
jgi:hypothetical protein